MSAGGATAEAAPVVRIETGIPRKFGVELPRDPVRIEDVMAMFPTLRQSLLARADQCMLSTLFELRYSNGWSTHPQARGILFHRFAAECLRTMQQHGDPAEDRRGRPDPLGRVRIPVAEALEILWEVVRQRDVPVPERVRPSMHDLRELRIAAIKFAADNRFTVKAIIDIERRISHPVAYDHPDGGMVERVLTGQPDVLLADRRDGVDGAIVIDWKDTWGLPPERVEPPHPKYADDGSTISYEGYFQQRFYGWLVMMEYPAVQYVTLREFYPRYSKVRSATLKREHLEHVERELSVLAEAFDATVAAGTAVKPWRPQPGHHCGFCAAPGQCPIEREARGKGAITSEAQARRYAAELQVAEEVKEHRTEALKTWVRNHGAVEVKHAKGRMEVGFEETKRKVTLKSGQTVTRSGTQFGTRTVTGSDRAAHPVDEGLAAALAESVDEAREARDLARKAKRRQRRKMPA